MIATAPAPAPTPDDGLLRANRIVYLYAIVEAVADPLTIPPPPPPRAPDVVQRRQPDSGGLA